jgi:hypothetical protein
MLAMARSTRSHFILAAICVENNPHHVLMRLTWLTPLIWLSKEWRHACHVRSKFHQKRNVLYCRSRSQANTHGAISATLLLASARLCLDLGEARHGQLDIAHHCIDHLHLWYGLEQLLLSPADVSRTAQQLDRLYTQHQTSCQTWSPAAISTSPIFILLFITALAWRPGRMLRDPVYTEVNDQQERNISNMKYNTIYPGCPTASGCAPCF